MILIKMREIQVILEGLKSGQGLQLKHCFSGVDKRVYDKRGGHTFQLGNNPKLLGIHFAAEGNIESVIPVLLNDRFEIPKRSAAIVFVKELGGDGMGMFELLDKQGLKPCSQILPTILLSDGPIFDGGDC